MTNEVKNNYENLPLNGTRYFFVEGREPRLGREEIVKRFSKLYKEFGEGIFEIENSLVEPVSMQKYNALLVKDFKEGLVEKIEGETGWRISR